MGNVEQQEHALEPSQRSLASELLTELRNLRTDNKRLERRLAKIETVLHDMQHHAQAVKIAGADGNSEAVDQFITEQIERSLASSTDGQFKDLDALETSWNYFIAQKGGYDEILYMTVQDFLSQGIDPISFLVFLLKKRDKEVLDSLAHLQEEYKRLAGNHLQNHFTELWQLHHGILKKKLIRTWKEEIFLEAFEAFILWLQESP